MCAPFAVPKLPCEKQTRMRLRYGVWGQWPQREPELSAASGRRSEAEVLVFQWRLPSRVGDGRALKTRGRSRLPPVEPEWSAASGTGADRCQWQGEGGGGSGLSVAIAEPYRRWQSPENQREREGGGGSGLWQAIGKPKGADRAAKTRGRGAKRRFWSFSGDCRAA